ncbi:hemopexin repeat-containing protein [Georgenia sp. SYP-B2076]|uniref:hemopexin repeat-containing protein n=1 Tax=Georgenia sp. SYP-B2076 TaxID=2495881 RepID=UPI000F8D2384|nr:hemopexin repeat-containing protein [Georgenia sp. SYP-B2076]
MTKAYVLLGDMYARYDVEADAVDAGYPKPITGGWAGLADAGFDRDIDTVLDLGAGKAYLFKGTSYLRIDQQTNAVDPGYPLTIADQWTGFDGAGFADSIGASANWGNGKAYFFKGDQVLRYDIASDGVDAGYPRPVGDEFAGLADIGFADALDAVVAWPSGRAYFFKGSDYAAVDAATLTALPGYPAAVDGSWPGLTAPVDAIWVRLTSGAGPAPAGGLGPGDHAWYYAGQVSTGQNIPRTTWFPGSTSETDYLGHGPEIFNFVVHADGEIRRGRPHMRGFEGTFAWLNMNPGNITGGQGGPDLGQYPGKANWHNFMIFPTEEIGFAAIGKLLRGPGYRDLTILAAFERYAPASDGNNPAQYAADVAAATGVPVTTVVRDLNDDQLLAMRSKIRDVEGARPGVTLAPDDPGLPAEIRALL